MIERRISRRGAIWAGTASLVAAYLVGARAVAAPAGRVPALSGYIGDYYALDLPQKLPPIVIADATGVRHDLSDMAGRVVLLNFWATWCAPCLLELPDLDRLQAHFAGDGLVVLALCTNARNASSVARFYATHGLRNLGVFFDPTGRDLYDWALTAIPTSFIIDRKGRARGMLPGGAAWNSSAGHALIEYYLSERSLGS